MKKRFLPLIAVAVLVMAGCATTKMEMASDLPEGPKDALLTGLTISSSSESNGSLVGAAMNLLGNLNLDPFGYKAQEGLAEFLAAKDFILFTDAEMAKTGDLAINMGSDMAALGGWIHPETSAYSPRYFTGPVIGGFDTAELIQNVKGNSDVNYFVYASLSCDKSYSFAGFIGGRPTVFFEVAVVDAQGEVVLEARAYGEGKSSFFGVDYSAENLSAALDAAIVKINEQ